MDWTVVLVVLGVVALVVTGLLAANVMNSLGHGPDVHDPLHEGEQEEPPPGLREGGRGTRP